MTFTDNKGFILTLDAMFALVVATSMIVIILSMSSTPEYTSRDYLYSLSNDLIVVVEKDDSLRNAVLGNPQQLNNHIFGQPGNICINLSIYDDQQNLVFTNSTNCTFPGWNIIGKRSVPVRTKNYVAKLEMWYG